MKGQFFIISTVIMISALILIMNYLYDYGKVDLTNTEKMQELNYIGDVKSSLTATLQTACANSEDPTKNLLLAEKNIKDRLEERGVTFVIENENIACSGSAPAGSINFTIKSNEFNIQNRFSV